MTFSVFPWWNFKYSMMVRWALRLQNTNISCILTLSATFQNAIQIGKHTSYANRQFWNFVIEKNFGTFFLFSFCDLLFSLFYNFALMSNTQLLYNHRLFIVNYSMTRLIDKVAVVNWKEFCKCASCVYVVDPY